MIILSMKLTLVPLGQINSTCLCKPILFIPLLLWYLLALQLVECAESGALVGRQPNDKNEATL